MPNIQPITLEHHATRRWLHYSSYVFAAGEAVIPLVASELPKAMLTLPIAFMRQDGKFIPAAILGLHPGKNLFVAADGRWLGGYIPASLRGYPFRLANTQDGQQVLCIDEDSGLVSDGAAGEGEAFFVEGGQPSKAIADVLNFYVQVEQNRKQTVAACEVLEQQGLILPWPIKIKSENGEQNIDGLFRVDETELNNQSDTAFLELRKLGALPIAYCQMLSMQHLPMLGKLAEAHAKADEQAKAKHAPIIPASQELDLEFLNNGGTISFGNLG